MSPFLLKIEATEARIASYAIPRGIAGRINVIRLQRQIRQLPRYQTTVAASRQDENDRDLSSRGSLDGDSLTLNHNGPIHADFTGENLPEGNYAYERTGRPVRRSERMHAVIPKGLTGNRPSPPLSVLRLKDTYGILEAVSTLNKCPTDRDAREIIRSIPASTFSELCRQLDPESSVGLSNKLVYAISPRSAPYQYLQPRGGPNSDGIYDFAREFMASIGLIMNLRLTAGQTLSLSDYKFTLRCLTEVGDRKALNVIWESLLESGIRRDTECFNLYLAARLWQDQTIAVQRFKLRVIPKHLMLRTQAYPPLAYQGHAVGNLKKEGIKRLMGYVFAVMAQEGVVADQQTYGYIMMAQAREGDMSAVQNILKQVWGIDVDQLLEHGEDVLGPVIEYPIDSPLRPTNSLLFALAHIYGTNNSIPTALRLIDYISRQYRLDITPDIWEELLMRTFVLTLRRGRSPEMQLRLGETIGQLPKAAVENLWNTLISPPYNVKPTLAMYDLMVENLLARQNFGRVVSFMQEGRVLHIENVMKYSKNLAKYRRAVRNSASPGLVGRMERELESSALTMHRSRQYIRRWCRDYLSKAFKSLTPPERNAKFYERNLQVWLEDWSIYLPDNIEYETSTGHLNFKSHARYLNKERSRRISQGPVGRVLGKAPKFGARRMGRKRLVSAKLADTQVLLAEKGKGPHLAQGESLRNGYVTS